MSLQRGELALPEVTTVLKQHCTAHLACHGADDLYVVPTSYVYNEDDECLECFAYEGRKISLLRENPEACVSIDEMSGKHSWKSVIAWGTFEEVSEADEQGRIIDALYTSVNNIVTEGGSGYLPFEDVHAMRKAILENREAVIYRIKINKITGRYEYLE